MTDTGNDTTTAEHPADLATMLVREIRYSRRLRLHLHRERIRHQHTRETLHVAVAMLRDYDRKLDRARQNAIALRDENRRIVRGKVTDGDHHHMPTTASAGPSQQVLQ